MKNICKKTVALFLPIAFLFLCSSPATAIKVKRYLGDVDGDGIVSTEDARSILLLALEISTGSDLTKEDLICADVDGSGVVNSADARLALLTAIGVIDPVDALIDFDAHEEDILGSINYIRRQVLKDENANLVLSEKLCDIAENAAKEFVENTGSAYVSSDGSLYYKALRDAGVEFTTADKAVIVSDSSYKKAYAALMASSQTKKALLSSNFDEIGIGAYSTDGVNFYWCVILAGNTEI